MESIINVSDDRIIEITQEVINEGRNDREDLWSYIESKNYSKIYGKEKTVKYRFPSNDDVKDFDKAVRYCTRELDLRYKPTIPTLFGMNQELKYRIFSFMDSQYPTQVYNMKELNWSDPNYVLPSNCQYISVAPVVVYSECYDKNITTYITKDGIECAIRTIKELFKSEFPQFSVIVTEEGERYLPIDWIKEYRKQLIDRTKHKDPKPYERQIVYVILKGISSVADILYDENGLNISEDDRCIYVKTDNYNGVPGKCFTFDKKIKKWKRKYGNNGGIPKLKSADAVKVLANAINMATDIPLKDIISMNYDG